MNLKDYFRELQRRHVVKAGIAYLVVAWLLVQVLDILFDAFELGIGWMQTIIIILSVGFPIWLIIAWVYDFTPEGIKKTEEVPFDPEVSRKKNIGLNRFIIGGLAVAVILLLINTFRLSNKVDTFEGQVLAMNYSNSLAILPFDDLSPDQDQRYFSDGLARSIYDQLARYKDLKLISPTSSFKYRDKDVSIEVIAEELGVRFIMEGSVQLFGDQYRASINLVDTQDGSTIWSKTFEDSLENVLATYKEVSDNVGKYLNVTLTSEDVRRRLVDPEAYLLFLKADDTIRKSAFTRESVVLADSLIDQSLQIDPNYAPSQVTKAMTTFHKTVYWGLLDRPKGLALAKESAYKAIEIDPEHPWGYLWVSNLSWHDRDIKTYHEYLKKMVEIGQNHPDVYMYQGFCKKRTNQVKEAYTFDKKAAILDPKNNEYNREMSTHEMYRADYEEALKWIDKIDVDWIEWRTLALADVNIYMGDFDKAEDLIKSLPPYFQSYARVKMLSFQGNKEAAEIELDRFIGFDSSIEGYDLIGTEYGHFWAIAELYAIMGDNDMAFEYLNMAYPEIVDYTESFFKDYSFLSLRDDPRWIMLLERLGREFDYDFIH